jgi:hypothetical protein
MAAVPVSLTCARISKRENRNGRRLPASCLHNKIDGALFPLILFRSGPEGETGIERTLVRVVTRCLERDQSTEDPGNLAAGSGVTVCSNQDAGVMPASANGGAPRIEPFASEAAPLEHRQNDDGIQITRSRY